MDLKDIITWVEMFVGFWVTYDRARLKQQDHGIRIVKLEKLMSSKDDGGAPFVTYAAHDRMQEDCQKQINIELSHIKSDIGAIKETVKNGDKSRELARTETNDNFLALQKLIIGNVVKK